MLCSVQQYLSLRSLRSTITAHCLCCAVLYVESTATIHTQLYMPHPLLSDHPAHGPIFRRIQRMNGGRTCDRGEVMNSKKIYATVSQHRGAFAVVRRGHDSAGADRAEAGKQAARTF
eukprot:COSAG01_NODE_17011_length_1185_cov_1.009208_1_plen_116_part_10